MKKRIIQLGLPAPMTLVPHLLKVIEEWHAQECQTHECLVYLDDDGVVCHQPATDRPSPAPDRR